MKFNEMKNYQGDEENLIALVTLFSKTIYSLLFLFSCLVFL